MQSVDYIALGILVALVAAACAGALGTAVHDERSHVYIAQARPATPCSPEPSTTAQSFSESTRGRRG